MPSENYVLTESVCRSEIGNENEPFFVRLKDDEPSAFAGLSEQGHRGDQVIDSAPSGPIAGDAEAILRRPWGHIISTEVIPRKPLLPQRKIFLQARMSLTALRIAVRSLFKSRSTQFW